MSRPLFLLTLLGLSFFAAEVTAQEPDAADENLVDFNRQVRPILARKCFACHGQDKAHREAGLRLDERSAALAPLESGAVAVAPGQPQRSELIDRVTSTDDDLRMPPGDKDQALSEEEIQTLKRWISQGAKYARHWSFVPPQAAPLPEVKNTAWPRQPLDYYILSRLEAEGLAPQEEATRWALVRRLSLDLRGLPPTPEEVQAFVHDPRPDAYERLVDRFLADPAYGERWARLWLDLARYADSAGYGSDPLRTIWRYRDWVIDAMNQNMPFDRFTTEQLAGDLLPEPTTGQRIATAFHRNTMTNTEGGTDDEEFRVAAVRDRVDTTMQVWMGLTFGCAKCHTHKYDPISQTEYYQLYDYFNHTADNDQPGESPTLEAPTPDVVYQRRKLDERIAELNRTLQQSTPELEAAQARWEAQLQQPPHWTVLRPIDMQSTAGASFQLLEDGSLLVSDSPGPQDSYILTTPAGMTDITAFRLETLPHESLPGGGAGHGPQGALVLSRFSAAVARDETSPAAIRGRFVRIELPGSQKMLSLAEVQVSSGGKNIAQGGSASQSSTAFDGPAQLAIDGQTDGHYFQTKSTTHTAVEVNPWWEVDLGGSQPLEQVTVWNRTDNNLQSRLDGFLLKVLDEKRETLWERKFDKAPQLKLAALEEGDVNIALKAAAADFSQQGFPASDAINPKDATKNGWAVAPKLTEPHWIALTTAQPLKVDPQQPLRIRLDQQFHQAGHTLGRFRLSASDSKNVLLRAALPTDVLAVIDTPADNRTAAQTEKLAAHYRSIAPELKTVRDEIAALQKQRPAFPTVPVMQELEQEKRRQTHLMVKGNFLSPGEVVQAAVPAAFHEFPEDAPSNRLGVARWLVDHNNPLTARVMMNRFWGQLFGVALVETEEDFGTQGELPSHPQLLDHLALEFIDGGWDVKAALRRIVTSATYRQSSRVTPDKLAADPRNRLLSRGPRFRLEAEMVRDQALALSGLLSRKSHGPSVYPPQPEGLWRAAFNGRDRKWPTDENEDRYRRGLYTFWRRTVPYPSMATFDAPSRELCTVRRIRTNTPLQAFVTLNDPVYIEASQALARRVMREGGENPQQRVRFALRLCLSRQPQDAQVAQLVRLYETELEHYRQQQEAAMKIATQPLGPLPEGVKPAEAAAWTVVANVLLNLDGVLTKG